MIERERLRELLLKCDPIKERDLDDDWGDGEIDDIVDSLLANGVIVPPCNVGDTVYHVYKGNTIVNALVEDWKKEAFGDWLFRACLSVNGSPVALLFGDNNIGKTVFLTREEAEKALEGRSET